VNSLEELIRITWIVSLVSHTLWDNVRLETSLKSVHCFAIPNVEPLLHESLEIQPNKTKEKKVRNAFIQSLWNIANEYSDRCSISCETNDGAQVDIRTATALKRLMTNITKSLDTMPSYSRSNPKFTLYDDKTSCSILRAGDYVIRLKFK
jgi:isoleucyl-tRNA synthetase